MKEEKRVSEKIKTITNIITIILFLAGIISASIIYANDQNKIKTDIELCTGNNILQEEKIKIIEERQNDIYNLIIEIRTDIKWIKETIREGN